MDGNRSGPTAMMRTMQMIASSPKPMLNMTTGPADVAHTRPGVGIEQDGQWDGTGARARRPPARSRVFPGIWSALYAVSARERVQALGGARERPEVLLLAA